MTNDSSWQDLYRDAMLELDEATLYSKIETARAAIRQAMEALVSEEGNAEDKQVMTEALRNLQVLQRLEMKMSALAASDGKPTAEA
jgi:signal transduction histidine kinase